MDNNVEQGPEKTPTAVRTGTASAAAVTAEAISGTRNAGATPVNTLANANSTFWKNSGRRVPGRPSPKRDLPPGFAATGHRQAIGSGMVSTFRDYQQSVSDAWDTGDDEFCIISSTEAAAAAAAAGAGVDGTRISRQMSQTAALNVIETHSRSNQNHNTPRANDCGSADQTSSSRSTPEENREERRRSLPDSNDNSHNYPGRPQLQKISSNSQDGEYETKIEKFQVLLDSPQLDLVALKKLSWSGVPRRMRAVSWRLLSKYLPPSSERRMAVLESKRQGYQDLRHNYFRVDSQDETQQDTYRQIHIDVPRMNPQIPLFQQQLVQEMFERVLFIWAIRHPASGYVQGINDLVTPFFIVFSAGGPDAQHRSREVRHVHTGGGDAQHHRGGFLLVSIQVSRLVYRTTISLPSWAYRRRSINSRIFIQRIDVNLHRHLQTHGVDYLQFSFRWMNNLLTRELPLHCTIRLWDTYLAESDGFALFHLYVCAAFLLHWKEQLMQQNDFQGLMLLLQNLPTHNWSDRQINVLLAEAFRLKFTYADAPKHLETKS
ncbi:GL21784 [Drosophila persimilis]|uniref:GL21784 n=1 Tax=Drosophila persimilis TaxID=7234 RepID=B4GEL2_DROPE|nr:GL21784 [Drosophila persimilis]